MRNESIDDYFKRTTLTDEEYIDVLIEILDRVNISHFVASGYDCTDTGFKETVTNCGMCCPDFVTAENALFPDKFPERKDMKHCAKNHTCPFDTRVPPDINGCLYKCYIFHPDKRTKEGNVNLNKLRSKAQWRLRQMFPGYTVHALVKYLNDRDKARNDRDKAREETRIKTPVYQISREPVGDGTYSYVSRELP